MVTVYEVSTFKNNAVVDFKAFVTVDELNRMFNDADPKASFYIKSKIMRQWEIKTQSGHVVTRVYAENRKAALQEAADCGIEFQNMIAEEIVNVI